MRQIINRIQSSQNISCEDFLFCKAIPRISAACIVFFRQLQYECTAVFTA